MKIELLSQNLKKLRRADIGMLRNYAASPTEQNQSYAIGYLQALVSYKHINWDCYHYLLALVAQVRDNPEVLNTLKKELATWRVDLG